MESFNNKKEIKIGEVFPSNYIHENHINGFDSATRLGVGCSIVSTSPVLNLYSGSLSSVLSIKDGGIYSTDYLNSTFSATKASEYILNNDVSNIIKIDDPLNNIGINHNIFNHTYNSPGIANINNIINGISSYSLYKNEALCTPTVDTSILSNGTFVLNNNINSMFSETKMIAGVIDIDIIKTGLKGYWDTYLTKGAIESYSFERTGNTYNITFNIIVGEITGGINQIGYNIKQAFN